MPIYEYLCLRCGFNKEIRQSRYISLTRCPGCEGPIGKVFYPVAAHFKGAGFFSTDEKPDTRVRGESGALGHLVSEIDMDTLDKISPTNVDRRGMPKATPTRNRTNKT